MGPPSWRPHSIRGARRERVAGGYDPFVTDPAAPPPPAGPRWEPARFRRRRDGGGVFFGLVILVVGLYFFLTETLGLQLPDMGELWPLFVIALGGWILIASMRPDEPG